jgi:hypothetical protein
VAHGLLGDLGYNADKRYEDFSASTDRIAEYGLMALVSGVAAKKLGLFRNFEWLHWVPTAPSKKDPATGKWHGGDLDGFPSGWGSTGMGIAGDCLYWGRSNSTNTTGPRVTLDVKIFKIQPNPEKDPPVEVGSMPQLTVDNGETAVRDRELRPYNYRSTDGVDRMLMVRSAATGTGGDVITYTLDPKTC